MRPFVAREWLILLACYPVGWLLAGWLDGPWSLSPDGLFKGFVGMAVVYVAAGVVRVTVEAVKTLRG